MPVPPAAPRPGVEDVELTRKGVCFLLSIVRQTVWEYEKRGLRFEKRGGAWTVKASALADFLIQEEERQRLALRARRQRRGNSDL